MTTQKEIARELDQVAARCFDVDAQASGKQIWFLAGLMAKAGEEPKSWDVGLTNTMAQLTKRKASDIIEKIQSITV